LGNNRLSHSVFTLFIGFRLHRRYYTTVELELANSRTIDSRSLELSTLDLSKSSLIISLSKSRVISFSPSLEVFARSTFQNWENSRTVGPKVSHWTYRIELTNLNPSEMHCSGLVAAETHIGCRDNSLSPSRCVSLDNLPYSLPWI
jgi:hypothetical protein